MSNEHLELEDNCVAAGWASPHNFIRLDVDLTLVSQDVCVCKGVS